MADGDRAATPPRRWIDAAVIAALLLAVLLSLWGRGFEPGTSQLGGEFRDLDWDHVDWNNHLWNLWDFRRVYRGEGDVLHTTSEFFPPGLRTVAAHGDLGLKALGGLLALLFSPDLTFLLVGLLLFWGNAAGGYLLGKTLTGSRGAGVLCGLLLLYAAPVAWAANTGNLEYGLWLWLCLYLVFLQRLLRDGRRLDMVLAALFGVLTVLGNYVFFFHLVLASAGLVLPRLPGLGSRRAGRVGSMVLLSALLLLPLAWVFYSGAKEQNLTFQRPPAAGDLRWEARVAHNNRARAGDYLPVAPERHRQDGRLPLVALALAALALAGKDRRRALPWLGVSLLFVVLSLGPYHAVAGDGGDGDPVPLPFLLLHRYLPMYHYIRFPHRMATFVILPLAAVGALGAAWLLAKIRGRALQVAVTAALLAAVLLEGNLTWAVKVTPRAQVNPYYDALARTPGRGAVVALPLDFGILDARHLYHQARHGKPVLNGVGVRYLGAEAIPTWALVKDNRLLRAAYALQGPALQRQELSKYMPLALPDGQQEISQASLRQGAAALKKLGFRHLLLHRELRFDRQHVITLPPGSELERTLRWALGEPKYQDSELVAWDL